MSKVCQQHKKTPAVIYGDCVGCELDNLRQEVTKLKGKLPQVFIGNAWYTTGGSLVADTQIPGITQPLPDEYNVKFYGKPFFIGESMTIVSAMKLATALGLKFCGGL